MGSLGFLTNHELHSFRGDLIDVIYGGQKLDSCTLLSLDSVNSMDEPGNSLGGSELDVKGGGGEGATILVGVTVVIANL